MPEYKFNAQKVATAGIDSKLDPKLQLAIWGLLESKLADESVETDYFQIFKLKYLGNGNVEVVHFQEEPEWRNRVVVPGTAMPTTDRTVYVVDDIEVVTMLFACEY